MYQQNGLVSLSFVGVGLNFCFINSLLGHVLSFLPPGFSESYTSLSNLCFVASTLLFKLFGCTATSVSKAGKA